MLQNNTCDNIFEDHNMHVPFSLFYMQSIWNIVRSWWKFLKQILKLDQKEIESLGGWNHGKVYN
jgi:hypothetical protein